MSQSIICFDWVFPSIIARRKTATRRDWSDDRARSFKPGDVFIAYATKPENGGKNIGTAEIISVTKERTGYMTEADYTEEGFKFLEDTEYVPFSFLHEIIIQFRPSLKGLENPYRYYFEKLKAANKPVWVIKFKMVENG